MQDEERLFRREAARLVSILTRLFGLQNLALAEDVVQDAFERALETWKFHGVPENPSAWLMVAAKRRALDVLRRDGTARRFAPELERELDSEWTLAPAVEEAFQSGLNDDPLRLMFSCIHPRLPEEAQVALVLNLLCGFGIEEVAAAFLKSRAAMEKRIVRAKKTLAGSRRLFDLTATDVATRLPAVHRALYLLFNEGYHGASADTPVRAELCDEALRLVHLLVEHRLTAVPATHALAALFNLLAARLPGRVDAEGNLLLLVDQDRSRWDKARIAEGIRQLDLCAAGDELTVYHLEAALAALHASAPSVAQTDWAGIVAIYDSLMKLAPSPVVALNRAVAISQRDGPERGLEEISRIDDGARLARYPFLHIALGELASRAGRVHEARRSFDKALGLARNPAERRFIAQRLAAGAAANGRPIGSPTGGVIGAR